MDQLPTWNHNISPLHSAVILGEKQKVLDLIQGDYVDVNIIDRHGQNSLFLAILSNKPEILELLIKSGGRADLVDVKKKDLLYYAADKNNFMCLKILVQNIASSSIGDFSTLRKDENGVTSLHVAAKHHSSKCLQLLLKYSIQNCVNFLDDHERTPLHWAAIHGSEECLKYLLKQDASQTLQDDGGKTALHYAASNYSSKGPNSIRILCMESCTSISKKDSGGRTPLHVAVIGTSSSCVEALLSYSKVEVNVRDNGGQTPLHFAAGKCVVSRRGLKQYQWSRF